ncbi:unnamed protein product [Orchesella dallaii]|uniref:Uncharacterized protein n=1 Tax=Orchesella dallaii TaxID=48710 RepID=A0ABP1RY92_9HEXA
MAKIYNLRLIYVLGDSSRKMSDGSWGRVQKHIPFVKLHAEHQIIVSLVRHLSHVSNVYIYSFLVSMTLELVLSIWILFDLFLSSNTHSIIEGLPVSKKGTVDLAVPMRVETMQGEWILSSSVMIIVTWLTYWFFGGVVHHAGEHLNTVTEYIRRHGLISCDSSKERRFILSIINSTAAKSGYWIGRSFHFNRIYLVALVGLIIGGSMVTVSFRPDRVSLNTYEVCNAHGQCTQIIASKSAESQIYNFLKHGQKPFPTYPPEYYTTPLPPLEDFGSGERYQKNIYIEKPACISYGVYPYTEVKLSVQCPANWKGEGTPYFLRLPLVHKPMLILDVLNSTEHPVFGVSRDMFNSSRKNGSFSECRSTDFPFYNYPYMDAFGKPPSTPPVDCFGDLVEPNRTDDCGNLAFPTLNVDGFRVEAKMMPIYVPNIAELQSVKGIVCCFEYGGFKGSEAQVQVCNLPNSTTFTKFCEMGSDRERLQVEHIQLHYRKLVERLHYQNKKGKVDSKGFIRKNEETIRDCLCKLYEPEVSLISEEHCACVGLQMLPCLPGYFTGIVEDYTLPCGAVKMPLLFKMSSDFSFVFPGEHERYKDVCVGDKFNDRFSHNDSLEYDYPCGLPNPVPSDSLNLTDCAGKPLITVRKDDCSNWNVSTPDAAKSGRMLGPLLKLKAFNYTLAGKKFVDTEEKNRAFTCCFEYQGQDFQTPEQKKYCNAPGVDAMNEGGWCGAVANNTKGMRNSTPFDSHLHEQLHTKLELTVRYHEAKMRYLWLEENKINEKWQRCMCTNMMTDVTFVDNQTYLDWVHKCIPLIVVRFLQFILRLPSTDYTI